MTDYTEILDGENRKKRHELAAGIFTSIPDDCRTRKSRDPVKRELMLQLGFPGIFKEVQYPSPGNTPDDLDEDPVQEWG